jgi:hypothetical protein
MPGTVWLHEFSIGAAWRNRTELPDRARLSPLPGDDDLSAALGEVRQRAPRNDPEFTSGDVPGFGSLDQSPRDKFPDRVVATMRQFPAGFLEDKIHLRPGALTQVAHATP